MSAPKSTILAVDDAAEVRQLLEATLGKLHAVKVAADARSALRLALEAPRPDLVLLDADLGGASGYEVCKAMKATPALAEVPVIFLSDVAKASDIAQGFRYGAIDCLAKPLAPAAVLSRVETHLEQIARERSIRLEHSREQMVGRLTRALELHSGWPSGNRAVRLAHYARVLAQTAGARDVACDLIMKAAPLFDIGKLGVPAELLRKEALLQGAEREQFQRHPAIGAEIIGESDDPLLKLAHTLALASRERWDGSGYPGHLKGNDIAWGGRVMSIVAAFEALTSPPYHRAPLPLERAAAEIAAEAGKQFDPALVQALQKALPAFRTVYETYSDRQLAEADDEVIGGPAAKREGSEADRTLIAPLALRGTPVSDEARARMAGERAAAEDKAAQAARERRDLEQAAALAAEQRALAEEKLAQAVEKRISAEARAGGADPQTAIALSRAQEMLAQLQKERGTLQAELERLQATLAEKEKERAAAPAGPDDLVRAALAKLQQEHGALQAELQRAKAALAEKEKQGAPAQALSLDPDDMVIGTASPAKGDLADDDLVIGSPPSQTMKTAHGESLAELGRTQAALAEQEKERAAAALERDKAFGEIERLQSALAEQARASAAVAEERDKALATRQRLEAALAETQKDLAAQAALAEAQTARAAAEAERDQALGELKGIEAALAAAKAERAAAEETILPPTAMDVVDKAALAEADEKRAAAEALRDEAIAELQRLETVLADAKEQVERSDTAAAQAAADVARVKEELAQARKDAAKAARAGDEAGRAALAQAQKERAAAEEALAQTREERGRTEELIAQSTVNERAAALASAKEELSQAQNERAAAQATLVQIQEERRRTEELTRGNEETGRRIAEDMAQVRAERERNEGLLAQLTAAQSSAAAKDREDTGEAARGRRQEDEAATRVAEERRLAEEALIASIAEREAAAAAAAERRRAAVREAAAQSLAPAAPRAARLAMGFVLGVLAAATAGAALWFSGVLEPAAPQVAPAAMVAAPRAAESPALPQGAPLQLRPDDTLPGARGER